MTVTQLLTQLTRAKSVRAELLSSECYMLEHWVYTCTAQRCMHTCVSVQAHAGICVQRPESNLHCCLFLFLGDIHLAIIWLFYGSWDQKQDTWLVRSLPSRLSWLPRAQESHCLSLPSTRITCAHHHTPHCMNLRDHTHSHSCVASI